MSWNVEETIRFFEQKKTGRVVMAGHGVFRMGDPGSSDDEEGLEGEEEQPRGPKLKKKGTKPKKKKVKIPSTQVRETGLSGPLSLASGQNGKFTVPQGMSIFFYCKHDDRVTDQLCHSIEGFTRGTPTTPVEVIKGGSLCYNYRLLYARGLNLNMSEARAKYEVITIPESRCYAAIPLTTLLRDSRCQGATEIHWCACREVVLNQVDWRNELLFASAQAKQDFYRSARFRPQW
jgi:hypothetical protein